jgi:hypothetical protein
VARQTMARFRIALTLLAVCGCLASTATSTHADALKVGFEPDRLGSSTTLAFDFALNTGERTTSSPLESVALHFPAGIAYETSSLGEASCEQQVLTKRGVRGCPADSRIGFGKAQIEVPLGGALLTETVNITIFVGRSENGQIETLYYATGTTPVIAQIVFPGELISETTGGELNTSIPLISTLPEAPDASVVTLDSTIGPKKLLYVTEAHGKSVRYHPRGIQLPKLCPRGGFAFSATFRFEDGSSTVARSVVPCPDRGHERHL